MTSVMLRASSRYRSSSAYSSQKLVRASDSAPSARPVAYSAAETMPSAASTPLPCSVGSACGVRSSALQRSIKPAAARATVDATATTRRDADSAASSGTTTSQIAANEEMPPVLSETTVTSPVSASDERTCALSKNPVRDKKYALRIGTISQANTTTSSVPGT